MRETEEKQRRAREAREKLDAEKALRAERKRNLVDMNAHETQEGVMDSLMEALQTGSAFSRPDQRRKRQTRAAGGKLKLIRVKAGSSYKFREPMLPSERRMFERKSGGSDSDYSDRPRNRLFSRLTGRNAVDTCTPEENQSVLKKLLIANAKRTPRKENFFSKLQSLGKSKYVKDIFGKCESSPAQGETPKRDLLHSNFMNTPEVVNVRQMSHITPKPFNFQRKSSTLPRIRVTVSESDIYPSPSLISPRDVSQLPYSLIVDELNHKMRSKQTNSESGTPMYRSWIPSDDEITVDEDYDRNLAIRKHVVASKMYNRNNIVRRAIMNRRRLLRNIYRRKSFTVARTPVKSRLPQLNPIFVTPAPDRAIGSELLTANSLSLDNSEKMRASAFNFAPLTKVKNYENIAQIHDENQNSVIVNRNDYRFSVDSSYNDTSPIHNYSRVKLFSPQLECVKSSLSSDSVFADSPRCFGREEIEASSISPAEQEQSPVISSSQAEATGLIEKDEPKTHPIFGRRKKHWKFWQRESADKVIAIKYKRVCNSEGDMIEKMKEIVDRITRNSSTAS